MIYHARELLARAKLGQPVDIKDVCDTCDELNDYRGHHNVKRNLRQLRDSLMFGSFK